MRRSGLPLRRWNRDQTRRSVALHEGALRATQADPWLYEVLVLLDAVRIGDARVREMAAELLQARLAEVPA